MSCKKEYTQHPIILESERLMDSLPSKAYELITSITEHESLSAADNAAWCLNYTTALYKLDSVIKSDSVIQISIDYYKKTPLNVYSGKSYYLLGCIQSDHKEYEKAILSFKLGESKLMKTKEYNILGLLYYKMGYIYSLDEFFDKSIEYFQKAAFNFHRAKNKKNEAYAYRDLANSTDNAKGNLDSVLHYFQLAQLLSLQAGDSANYYETNFNLSITLLSRTKDYQKAKQYLLSAYRYDNFDPYYYNKLSLLYASLHQPDTALYYFQQSLPDTLSIYSKVATYLAGAYAEKANGNYAKALEYFMLYDENRNKVSAETKRNQLYRIDYLSELNKTNKETENLKTAHSNMVISVAVLVIILLLVLLIMLKIQTKRKEAQDNYLIEKQKLLSEIKQKRLLIFSRLKNRIEVTLRFSEMRDKISFANKEDHHSMNGLLEQFVLSEVAWQSCIDGVNFIYNNHLERLSNLHPTLSLTDKIVMALISLQLDITDSCIVLGLTKNTMYRRRNTIKERLGLEKTIDLELWLLDQMAQNLTEEEQLELLKKVIIKDNY